MVGRSQSDLLKGYTFRSIKDELQLDARDYYIDEQTRPLMLGERRTGFRAACSRISDTPMVPTYHC